MSAKAPASPSTKPPGTTASDLRPVAKRRHPAERQAPANPPVANAPAIPPGADAPAILPSANAPALLRSTNAPTDPLITDMSAKALASPSTKPLGTNAPAILASQHADPATGQQRHEQPADHRHVG
jgi:hypothetical protein